MTLSNVLKYLCITFKALTLVTARVETLTAAAGCYWGIELVYQRVPGVLSTQVGFCGGKGEKSIDPKYPAEGTGHAETVEVIFDPDIVSYMELLDIFWEIHDPFNSKCQGYDCGESYRTALWYHSVEQRNAINESKNTLEKLRGGGEFVATQVLSAAAFKFWPSHEEHQKYLEKMGIDASKGSLESFRCYGVSGKLMNISDKENIMRILTKTSQSSSEL
eukprot:GSMAST32.ASY1.ANO1.2787.1 assembled CDS